MTIKEALVRAVAERNVKRVGAIADVLRFRAGMNYEQMRAFSGAAPDEWLALMEDVDAMDSEEESEVRA